MSRFGLCAVFTLVAVLVPMVASGCCNIAKAPGRCVGCAYDNCIIPYGSKLPRPVAPKKAPSVPDTVDARAMSY